MPTTYSTPSVQQQNAATEFAFKYSESDLLEKLNQYDLNLDKVIGRLNINLKLLKTIALIEIQNLEISNLEIDNVEIQNYQAHLNALKNKLINWPAPQNLTSLTVTINELVNCWLNAMQNGASSTSILNFLRCIELRSFFGLSQTAQLHCFLLHLVLDTAQSQLKNQLDYALNFDAGTKLPYSSQIICNLNEMANDLNAEHLIGLFSVYFQISKNKPIYSHTASIHLNQKIVAVFNENINFNWQLYSDGNLQFNILLTGLTNDMQVNLLAAKLSRAFEQAILLENQTVLITPFIGCACTQKSSSTIDHLYNSASLALSKAIQSQQPFVLYSEDFQAQLSHKMDQENKVLEAFSSDNLTLYFQPIVDIKNTRIVGAELLLRWTELTGFNVAPALTVEILNQSGRGKLFTRWLINSACRYASELKHEHQLNIYLTLNLQTDDLYDTELPHLLLQSIALWRIKPEDIVLEITENGFLEYNETSKSVINELVKNGFKLALDDFGTGYSSLSRLRNMPIDIIKIDQSFVRDIKHSSQDLEIVKSIALLAKSLGKEVLAEGVEDEDCLSLIKKMKIDKCQGYFFARPMPYEQFIAWANDHCA